MFCYSSLNGVHGLGWALLHNVVLAFPLLFTLLLALAAMPFLLRQGE
jgi:hypothetical protein